MRVEVRATEVAPVIPVVLGVCERMADTSRFLSSDRDEALEIDLPGGIKRAMQSDPGNRRGGHIFPRQRHVTMKR